MGRLPTLSSLTNVPYQTRLITGITATHTQLLTHSHLTHIDIICRVMSLLDTFGPLLPTPKCYASHLVPWMYAVIRTSIIQRSRDKKSPVASVPLPRILLDNVELQ